MPAGASPEPGSTDLTAVPGEDRQIEPC